MPILFGPLYQCPQCNQSSSFGRCFMGGQELTFRCQHCDCFRVLPLPAITKKIIYIDQFAISKMANSKSDSFWPALYERLTDLAAKVLIACPHSSMHVEESLLSIRLREDLKAIYRNIGGQNKFKRASEIRKAQLARSLKLFLGKPDLPDDDPLWRDWSCDDPNRWSDTFAVHVDFGIDEDSVRQLREVKSAHWERMKDQAEEWRQQPKSFDEDIEANYISLRTTLATDNWLGLWLAQWVEALDAREENPLAVVNQFFLSDKWKQAPFPYLWVRSWAKIGEMVRSPRGSRKPQLGDYYDAQILTHYSPYCHAMFIDGGYREIARDPRVGVEERFGTKCFSEQNRDQFLAYLDEIEQGMPTDHKKALGVIHPPYSFNLEDLVDPFAWRHVEGEAG